jgi:hypothetical protein
VRLHKQGSDTIEAREAENVKAEEEARVKASGDRVLSLCNRPVEEAWF